MSKTYKGHELIRAISDGEIKENTRFREMEENRYYIVKDRKLWEQEDIGIYNSKLENLQITYGIFELIEGEEIEGEEIDIQSIKEFEIDKNNYIQTDLGAFKTRKMDIAFLNKINELVQAVNQLDKRTRKEEE